MKVRLCKLLVCLFLGFGSIAGMAMRPDEIEALMRNMNQPLVETTLPNRNDNDDPLKKFPRARGVNPDGTGGLLQ